MTENERLTFRTDLGISIDKNEDCPTMSICWNCDIPPRKCKYFKDVIDKLAKYETIGTIDEFKILKKKAEPKKVAYQGGNEKCPACGSFHVFGKHCTECGQVVDYD